MSAQDFTTKLDFKPPEFDPEKEVVMCIVAFKKATLEYCMNYANMNPLDIVTVQQDKLLTYEM